MNVEKGRFFQFAYLVLAGVACYFLSSLPFTYSYFNLNLTTYFHNKKLCQWVEGEKIFLGKQILSLALSFDQYMNREIPDHQVRIQEECPDR